MHLYHTAAIHTYRRFEQLIWLSVKTASLAHHAQPGQIALVRHSQPGLDPLLWTTLFLAGADPGTGTVEFLIDPRDPTVIWLSELSPGTTLDLCVPGGKHFSLKPTTQTLLLAGTGSALPALLFLARQQASRQNIALFMAGETGFMPPPFLLPPTVEIQFSLAGEATLFDLLTSSPQSPLRWADQIGLALPPTMLAPAENIIRSTRLRWQPGLAQVVVAGSLPCGLGVCRACQIETRRGWQRRCVEGPVFDLYDLRLSM